MRPALQHYIEEVEAVYGRLGEAQLSEMNRLLEENSGFRHLKVEEKWQRVNTILASENWQPPAKDENHAAFAGDEFPDIYRGNIESIDMNDLL